MRNDGKGYDMVGRAYRMSDIVGMLAGQFGHPVADRSGLIGTYDFVLKYHTIPLDDHKPDEDDPMPSMQDTIRISWG